MIWRCVICSVFVALTLNKLLSHINTAHSHSPDFHLVCGIGDCSNEYRVYNSLYYHIRRAHPEHLSGGKGKRRRTSITTLATTLREPTPELAGSRWAYRPPENSGQRDRPPEDRMERVELAEDHATMEDNGVSSPEHFAGFDTSVSLYSGFTSTPLNHELPQNADQESPSASSTDPTTQAAVISPDPAVGRTSMDRNRQATEICPDVPEPAEGISASCTSKELTRQATAIVWTAREKHSLTQSALNDIVAGMQQYQALLVSNLQSQQQAVLQQHPGIELQNQAMAVFDQFEDPFASVSTTYRRDSVIKEMFDFVESEEVCVGQTACVIKKGAKRILSMKSKCFHYVPLIESLKQLLSHPKVMAMIDEPQRCRNGYLYDVIDGELMKSHPLFSARPSALKIIIYSDDIDVCNALGSHASKHKLTMFYYTLANINPKYRSKLAAIRLLAIAKRSELSKCGVDAILERLHRDMVRLYNGVKIQIGNGEREIFGALVSICGDTLAQHELCGFKEGVGFAYSKCRHCECSFDDMQTYFDDDHFEKRTIAKHLRQCCNIEKANTKYLRSSLKTAYGINRRSKLLGFPGFDLIQQSPQDIMHLILEGAAQLEIKCVIKELVLSGELQLDDLNSAIIGFPYCPLDIGDKPSPIAHNTLASSENKLKQSSGQMLVLLKILPFLIDKIKGHEYYTFLLELIQIVQILFAPVIGLQTINKLKTLIDQHLQHMKNLFPDNNIVPKQHYLIHVPSQIKQLGPMVRHMCMRFESKHCLFKRWALKSNFKNICKSLIRNNQMYECCQTVSSEHPIFANECVLGPTSEINSMSYLRDKMKAFFGNVEVNHAVSVKWISLNGNKYIRDKTLVVSSINTCNLPEFGLVRDIFVINSAIYCLELQQHNTLCYDTDYMAYKIEIPHMAHATELVSADNLVDYTPYYRFTHKDMEYVPMKYYLGDVIGLYKASD